MARAGFGMIAAALALAGCASWPAQDEGPKGARLRVEIEEVLAPQVFRVEAEGRVAGAGEPAGLWAAAPGLPRPERGEVLNPATGAAVTVSLFRSSGRGIRVSRAAAEAIGLERDGPVRVTAIRTEPRVLAFDRRERLSYSDQTP